MNAAAPRVVALSGGVGGAKLSLGLQQVLPQGELAVIVNTGDDFEHVGLCISPDLDTMLYTLAGLADEARGWGRAAESWQVMAEFERIGLPTWFRLGDKDLALHLERTRQSAAGQHLSSITAALAERLGVPSRILPMTDGRVRTLIDTDRGTLEFQDYFVRQRCEPVVHGIRIEGAAAATAPAGAEELLQSSELQAIVICPSNPYLSLDPILAMPFWREKLRQARAPVIAVSPVIGGDAVKGPTAKIMRELGRSVTVQTVADHYAGLIDGLIIDHRDAGDAETCRIPVHITKTLMNTLADRELLARETLAFASRLYR